MEIIDKTITPHRKLSSLLPGIYLAEIGESRHECLLIVHHAGAAAIPAGSTGIRGWRRGSNDFETARVYNIRRGVVDSLVFTQEE